MIVPMKRLRIVGPRSLAEKCVGAIHQTGLLHVVNSRDDSFLANKDITLATLTGEKGKELRRNRVLLADLRSGMAHLHMADPHSQFRITIAAKAVAPLSPREREKIEKIVATTLQSARVIRRLRLEQAEVTKYRILFEEFSPLVRRCAAMRNVETYGFLFREKGEKNKALANTIEKKLTALTNGACVVERSEGDDLRALLLVYPRSMSAQVREDIFEPITGEIETIDAPARLTKNSFAETLLALFRDEADIQRRCADEEKRLRGYAKRWSALLLSAEQSLSRRVAEIAASGYLALSERTFWISGWVPTDAHEVFIAQVLREMKERVAILQESPSRDQYDSVPTLLRNPPLARPFETALALFPAPRYGSFDPTILMAVFIPLFFGMMLGDLGYAFILYGMATFVGSRMGHNRFWRDAATMLKRAAMATALFGLVYGEFFGKWWSLWGLPGPLFHRKDEAVVFMTAMIIVGGLHILLAVLIALRGALQERAWREGMVKGSDAVILVTTFYLIYQGTYGGSLMVGLVVLGAGLATKLGAGGFAELIETSRLLSSVLSYARIMAVGMASIIFADLADDIFLTSPSLFWGVCGLLFVHGINLLFGLFDPGVQALRLHYVEFFSQFYRHGAVRYAPLGGANQRPA